MGKTPLSRCVAGEAVVRELVGLQIDRGVLRQMNARIGGPRGCAHLAELVTDAVHLLGMIRLGGGTGYWGDGHMQRSEEEVIAEGRERLRNSCIVFADEWASSACPGVRRFRGRFGELAPGVAAAVLRRAGPKERTGAARSLSCRTSSARWWRRNRSTAAGSGRRGTAG